MQFDIVHYNRINILRKQTDKPNKLIQFKMNVLQYSEGNNHRLPQLLLNDQEFPPILLVSDWSRRHLFECTVICGVSGFLV